LTLLDKAFSFIIEVIFLTWVDSAQYMTFLVNREEKDENMALSFSLPGLKVWNSHPESFC